MMKHTLSSKSALKTRYETTEFILNNRVGKAASVKDGAISLFVGTNILSIDDGVKITDKELMSFVRDNFTKVEETFKRIKFIVSPSSFSFEF